MFEPSGQCMSIMHNECKEAIAQQGHNDAASNLFNNSGPLIPGDLMQPRTQQSRAHGNLSRIVVYLG